MRLFDYIYILLSLLAAVFGLINLWKMANKRRDDSINDYLEKKQQRLNQFNKR